MGPLKLTQNKGRSRGLGKSLQPAFSLGVILSYSKVQELYQNHPVPETQKNYFAKGITDIFYLKQVGLLTSGVS